MSRLFRHLLLAVVTGVWLLTSGWLLSYDALWERISVGSAWLCLLLLCAALLIGPLRRAGGKSVPVNIYFRRDLGIWSALLAFLHFYAGNVVAMNQDYIGAFVRGAAAPPTESVRNQLFSYGSIAGLIVAVLFLLLLVISSDRALRWLRPERWKKIQRSSHVALWLTVLHGIAFQVLEARFVPLGLMLGLAIFVLILQFSYRRKDANMPG